MSVIALRSSSGWRSTMSISLSPSRYWPTVLPDRIVRDACAIVWLVTPSARALSWSMSSRSTFTDSFQLSFTPRMFGLRTHDVLGLVGPHAHLLRIGADDAELHRVRHRRAVRQQLDARADFREFVGHQRRQPLAQRFALSNALGQHDRLADVGLREDLVERQIETRHAAADPGGDAGDACFLHHPRLEALRDLLGARNRAAFGQPDVDQDLGPARIGKELLLHAAHADDAERESQQRQSRS